LNTDAYSPHPVHIEMEEFSGVRFTQCAVIELLTAEKSSSSLKFIDECKPFMVVDVSAVRRWVRWFRDGDLGASRFE